jgi:hypothetical protein
MTMREIRIGDSKKRGKQKKVWEAKDLLRTRRTKKAGLAFKRATS